MSARAALTPSGISAFLFIKEAPFANEISHVVSNAADTCLSRVACGRRETCREVVSTKRTRWFNGRKEVGDASRNDSSKLVRFVSATGANLHPVVVLVHRVGRVFVAVDLRSLG